MYQGIEVPAGGAIMHGESVGFAVASSVASADALVAVFLYGLSRRLRVRPAQVPVPAATPAE